MTLSISSLNERNTELLGDFSTDDELPSVDDMSARSIPLSIDMMSGPSQLEFPNERAVSNFYDEVFRTAVDGLLNSSAVK